MALAVSDKPAFHTALAYILQNVCNGASMPTLAISQQHIRLSQIKFDHSILRLPTHSQMACSVTIYTYCTNRIHQYRQGFKIEKQGIEATNNRFIRWAVWLQHLKSKRPLQISLGSRYVLSSAFLSISLARCWIVACWYRNTFPLLNQMYVSNRTVNILVN